MDDEKWMKMYRILNSNLEGVEGVLEEAIETLKEKSFNRRIAFDLLLRVAEEKPDVLLDKVESLKDLIGEGFESVYASMVLGKLSLRHPNVVDNETLSRIFDLLSYEEVRGYVLLALSDIALSNPDLLSNRISKLVELIRDRNWVVRWNTAKVFLNLIESDIKYLEPCVDLIEEIAENERLKPSVRVVAHVILNSFRENVRSNP